jgi:hypothetical protein
VHDRSLNRPQGEVDNRLRINQPQSEAPPESRGSDEGDAMGTARNARRKDFHSASLGQLL